MLGLGSWLCLIVLVLIGGYLEFAAHHRSCTMTLFLFFFPFSFHSILTLPLLSCLMLEWVVDLVTVAGGAAWYLFYDASPLEAVAA